MSCVCRTRFSVYLLLHTIGPFPANTWEISNAKFKLIGGKLTSTSTFTPHSSFASAPDITSTKLQTVHIPSHTRSNCRQSMRCKSASGMRVKHSPIVARNDDSIRWTTEDILSSMARYVQTCEKANLKQVETR